MSGSARSAVVALFNDDPGRWRTANRIHTITRVGWFRLFGMLYRLEHDGLIVSRVEDDGFYNGRRVYRRA